jgi:hypothetical protein
VELDYTKWQASHSKWVTAAWRLPASSMQHLNSHHISACQQKCGKHQSVRARKQLQYSKDEDICGVHPSYFWDSEILRFLFLFLSYFYFCPISISVLFLSYFCSISVLFCPVLFYFCPISVLFLFLSYFCPISISVLFLFVLFLFLFLSYFWDSEISISISISVLFLFLSYFYFCSISVLFLFYFCPILSCPVLFYFCSISVLFLFYFCPISISVLFLSYFYFYFCPISEISEILRLLIFRDSQLSRRRSPERRRNNFTFGRHNYWHIPAITATTFGSGSSILCTYIRTFLQFQWHTVTQMCHETINFTMYTVWGHAVGSGFDSRWCHWIFFSLT